MRKRLFFILCFFSYAVAGCAGMKYSVPVPADHAEGQMERMLERIDPYPGEFRLSQHIIMKVRDKENDFPGYLLVKRKKGFRAIAFGEMGGRIFDLIERDGKRKIAVKPGAMPSNPLLNGVMGDIRHLYDIRESEDAYLSRNEKNTPSLVVRKGEDSVFEYLFSAGGDLIASLEAVDGRLVRSVSYSGYRLYDGWERPLPSMITLVNYRWHYELRVDLLKIDAGPVDEQMLFDNKNEE
ncbi:MAG: hypothetical protein IT392_07755 [Nitrospirae bacterium]|nr:hypothetical protein [Nitrospirota bacterium]